MSVRNQFTHYELEEFFRSWQDLLVLSLNASLSFDSAELFVCTNLNPILGFPCKISLTISSREVLSMSVNDSVKLVTPNSFLRLRKVLSETRRFLAMAAQRNPAPLRSTLPTNLLKYRASTSLEHLISQHPLWRLKVVLPPLRAKRNKISPRNVAFVD